jgi:hypothetical protein
MGRPNSPETKTDDISGILILRHLLSEVIASFQTCGLERLAAGLEAALRWVQPSPSQPMRKRKAGAESSTPSKRGYGAPRRRGPTPRLRA